MHAACDLLDTFQGWEGVAEESNALSFRSWTTLLFLQTYVFQCMPFSWLKESQRSSTCVWSARNTVCAKKNVNWTAAVVIARHELWPLAGSMLCGYGLKWGIPKIGWSIDRLTPGVPWTQNFIHTHLITFTPKIIGQGSNEGHHGYTDVLIFRENPWIKPPILLIHQHFSHESCDFGPSPIFLGWWCRGWCWIDSCVKRDERPILILGNLLINYEEPNIRAYYVSLPVVPHKAKAEVSKIGNL